MPISEEQRKILLERLEKARTAKELKKQETKQAAAAPKPRAKPKPKVEPVPIQEEPITLEVKDTLTSSAVAPTETKPLEVIPVVVPYDAEHLAEAQQQEKQEKREKPIKEKKIFKMDEEIEDDHKSQKQKQQKKAYAKVVFYEKPSKAESKRLMKAVHEEESSEEEEEEEDEEQMVKDLLHRYGHRIVPANIPMPMQLRGHPQFRTHTDPAALASRNQYLSQLAKQCFY
jgi:hypothetical protein